MLFDFQALNNSWTWLVDKLHLWIFRSSPNISCFSQSLILRKFEVDFGCKIVWCRHSAARIATSSLASTTYTPTEGVSCVPGCFRCLCASTAMLGKPKSSCMGKGKGGSLPTGSLQKVRCGWHPTAACLWNSMFFSKVSWQQKFSGNCSCWWESIGTNDHFGITH